MSKPTANFRRLSFAVAGFNVDRQAGILKNLCLLAANREAKGHGIYVDAETIKTGHAILAERKQLKGAIRHLSWDEYFSKGADRVLDFPGWFAGFSIKGEQLVAEKFEFYETFRNDPEQSKSFARIMEMAEKTPDLFGLSIEAWGYVVFVAEDGKEYGTKPDGVALKYDGVPALRITDLFFAAFVDEPAATDGLFARFSTKFPALSALFGGKHDPERDALIAQLRGFAAELEASGVTPTVPLSAPIEPTSENSIMKIIGLLKAKITDAQRFAAAMAIVGNTPEDKLASLSVADVEAQLQAADLAAATGEVTRLKAELGTRDAKITELSADRDLWRQKYEALKASGRGADVNLGAPEGGNAGADEPNPWMRATLNRTRQAEILSKDPERAKALKAAAQTANAAAAKAVAFSFMRVSNTRFFATGLAAIALVVALFVALAVLVGPAPAAAVILALNVWASTRGAQIYGATEWTKIANLWVPEVIQEAMAEPVVDRTAFIDSGVVASNSEVVAAASGPGTDISIKYVIDPDHADQLQQEDTAPEMRKITSGSQRAAIFNRVSPLGATALSGIISGIKPGGDILSVLLSKIQGLRKRQRHRLVISALSGLFDVTAAPNAVTGAFKALRYDAFSETGASPSSDYLIDTTKLLYALALLGENKDFMIDGAIVMHSAIEAALVDQEQIDVVRNSEGQIVLRQWKGMQVFVSDKLVRNGGVSGKVYYTFLCGRGSIAMGDKPQVVTDVAGEVAALQLDLRDIAKNNVAIYDRTRFICHPQGAKWDPEAGVPAAADAGPSNAELEDDANWALGAADIKNTRIVCLRTNG